VDLVAIPQVGHHVRIETPGRLLLIEDDDRIARLLSRALADGGYVVDCVATGPEGLHKALADSFDLILLDLMLPGMDGLEVLRALVDQRPGLRVLVLSAVPDISTRVACLEAGAVDFVGKPFALAELLARVRARIRPPAPDRPGSVLEVGPVRLDLQAHHAIADGRQVTLTYREFLLLRYVMERAGQACSRGELLQRVWDLPFDPGSNVVDVTVRRLRGKLRHIKAHTDMDETDLIETVRNVGYRYTGA